MRFQGRANEAQALSERLRLACSGRGQVVFVEGPGGIGKTRLVGEILVGAEPGSLEVLLGRCDELERHRPFGALVDALGCDRRSPDPQRNALARLLDADAAHGFAWGSLQYRVVEAFVELVESLACYGPLVLVLEDLHWSDPSTLSATYSLARRIGHLPVMLIGTRRPVPTQLELDRLVQTCTDEGGLRLELGPLDDAAVAALGAEVVGAEPGPRLRRQFSSAGGNPLFLVELVSTLVDAGAVEFTGSRAEVEDVALPPALGVTILRRFSLLSEATLDVLRLASLLGSTFTLAHLSVVARRPTVDLLPAIAEGTHAGVLEEAGSELRFRHDLLREGIYHDLPLSVRVGLHREVGRALEAAGAPAAQVATHFVVGATPGDHEALERLARGAREIAAHAPGMAVRLLERGVELIDRSGPGRDELLAELTNALVWSGQLADAVDRGREILGRHHDPSVEGRVRLATARALFMQGKGKEGLQVLELPSQSGTALTEWEQIQCQADRAWGRLMTGDLDVAHEAAGTARAMSESAGEELAYCVAVSVLSLVALFRGNTADAVELAALVVDKAEHPAASILSPQSWTPARFPSHYWLVVCLLEADRLDEARAVTEAARRFIEDRGNAWTIPLLHCASALTHFLAGEWDDAGAEVETAIAVAGDVGARQGLVYGQAIQVLVCVHRGDLEGAQRWLTAAQQELAASGPQYRANWVDWARALLYEATGRVQDALATLEKAWNASEKAGFVSEYPVLGPDLVRLSRALGAPDRARAVTNAVQAAAARMKVFSAEAAARRCQGLLEDDPDTLVAAASSYRTRPLEQAQACEEAAAALGRAGRTGEAVLLLSEALSIYERLRATRGVARCEAALRTLGIRRGRGPRALRPPTGWEALTGTERAVVELAAQGLTNRQIGERMFISRRTVETHLAHAFAKLGVSSRSRLATEVVRRAATNESATGPLPSVGSSGR